MVDCGEFGAEFTVASMSDHLYMQHGRSVRARPLPLKFPLHRPKEYWLAFLQTSMSIDCPVEVCTERETINTNLRLHSMHWHVEDTIVVLN